MIKENISKCFSKTFFSDKITTPLVFAVLLLLVIVIKKAFLLEDAFIVFRSIQNLENGFFLSAIADVRSQSYTSNLWTLLLVVVDSVSLLSLQNNAIIISLTCTFITVIILIRFFTKIKRPDLGFLLIILLALSNTFTDFSTGGLENSLAHLLLAIFLIILMFSSYKNIDFLVLSCIAGLLVANRYDHLFMVAPSLVLVFFSRKKWKEDIINGLAGFMPLFMWMFFSWFYYGSILADTYYAKIYTGVPVFERINFAIYHHLRMLDVDFISMTLMVFTIMFGMMLSKNILLRNKNKTSDYLNLSEEKQHNIQKLLSIITGILLYNIYFFYVGGDYMLGRFMSIVILAVMFAVVLIIEQKLIPQLFFKPLVIVLMIICIIKLTVPTLFVPGRGDKNESVKVYTFNIRKFGANWYFIDQDHDEKNWRREGFERALEADKAPYPYSVVAIPGGIIPYYAGSRHYLIDLLGLSEPLLSRLPCTTLGAAAHCMRVVPDGYENFIKAGDLSKIDPDLAQYVDVLFKIKKLPLFDIERIKLLVWFSLGRYDKFKLAYISKHVHEYYQPNAEAAKTLFYNGYNETILKQILGSEKGNGFVHPLYW